MSDRHTSSKSTLSSDWPGYFKISENEKLKAHF